MLPLNSSNCKNQNKIVSIILYNFSKFITRIQQNGAITNVFSRFTFQFGILKFFKKVFKKKDRKRLQKAMILIIIPYIRKPQVFDK